jgi:large subunit ribosomal protein L10
VRERFEASSAVFLTDCQGLDMADLVELRRALRDAGSEYRVYRKTLVRFVAREAGLELDGLGAGPTAIAFVGERPDGTAGDPIAVAKTLRDFGRSNPALVIKGGLLSGAALSAEQAQALADIPPREVLLRRLANCLARAKALLIDGGIGHAEWDRLPTHLPPDLAWAAEVDESSGAVSPNYQGWAESAAEAAASTAYVHSLIGTHGRIPVPAPPIPWGSDPEPYRRLLVVIDHRDKFHAILHDLGGVGWTTHEAENVLAAEEHLRKQEYFAVIMQLDRYSGPDKGFDDAHQILQAGLHRGYVVLTTAWLTPARRDRARALQAAIAGTPVDLSNLMRELVFKVPPKPIHPWFLGGPDLKPADSLD